MIIYIKNSNNNNNPFKIIDINNLETKLLDYYNNMYFITKQYSNQIINSILPDEFKNYFEKYLITWNELNKESKINNEMKLENILNTNDSNNKYGYKIFKFYKNIIDTNNKYISIFINYIKNNKLSKYWEKFLKEEKLVQNLYSEYNFFSFEDEMIKAEKYNNLYEILINNSNRDIIYKENKFYFKNFKNIKYDLIKIENLFKISFLIGKSSFKEKQILIEYNKFDPLNKNIFYDYNKLYKQDILENSKKTSIRQLLNKSDENEKKKVLYYIKKLMKLNKSNNIIKNDIIIRNEIINKYFDTSELKLFNELLNLEIKNSCIVDLYEFIELSIIYERYHNKKIKNDFENIMLKDSTISILRKFYLRFIDNDENIKDEKISENIFDNKDLFFKIPYKRNSSESNKCSFLEDIKKDLFQFKIQDCLKIYLTFISQDKDLQNYTNIEKKTKKKKKNRNN